jgi:hypothetical protein
VSSCTGDAHLGDATTEYTPDLTVEHNGSTNSGAALSYLAATYPDAEQVVVIGKTAGSIAAAGVDLHSYTAPGEGHGIFEYDDFYETEVDGVRLVDWLDALVAGDPLDDVHCGTWSSASSTVRCWRWPPTPTAITPVASTSSTSAPSIGPRPPTSTARPAPPSMPR